MSSGIVLDDIQIPKSKEKSLGFLAVGFIKLFLGWKKIITLDQAAENLTHKTERHKLKTKIRRLYDIANVFLALGIIKKAYLSNRKPAFKWRGSEGLIQMMKMMGIDMNCLEESLEEKSDKECHDVPEMEEEESQDK